MPPTVGETLAAERRRKGKSLADVSAATRIRARLLESLENDRYDELPSPAYVKGYIQSYASYLDMPADPLVKQYASEQRLAGPGEPQKESKHPYLTEQVVPPREHAHALPARSWTFIVAVLIVAGLAVFGISKFVASRQPTPVLPVTETPSPKAKAKHKARSVVPTAPPSTETTLGEDATSSAEATGSGETSPTPFSLRVRATNSGGGSYLRIVIDGEERYDGTLPAGDTRNYTVQGEADVRIGDPRAVLVYRDGRRIDTPDNDVPFTLDVKASDTNP